MGGGGSSERSLLCCCHQLVGEPLGQMIKIMKSTESGGQEVLRAVSYVK